MNQGDPGPMGALTLKKSRFRDMKLQLFGAEGAENIKNKGFYR